MLTITEGAAAIAVGPGDLFEDRPGAQKELALVETCRNFTPKFLCRCPLHYVRPRLERRQTGFRAACVKECLYTQAAFVGSPEEAIRIWNTAVKLARSA